MKDESPEQNHSQEHEAKIDEAIELSMSAGLPLYVGPTVMRVIHNNSLCLE
ncbi:MAG: hypothetical protein GY845_21320 [Planctomycetes bacterium]|nr:hypothetical protein [Planctomycetota bacterium]